MERKRREREKKLSQFNKKEKIEAAVKRRESDGKGEKREIYKYIQEKIYKYIKEKLHNIQKGKKATACHIDIYIDLLSMTQLG